MSGGFIIKGVASDGLPYGAQIDADATQPGYGKLLTGAYLVDENGVLYGVKHIDNKPRVSSVPYLYDIAKGSVANHTPVNKFGHNSGVGASLEPIWDFSATYDYLADDTFATMYISSDNSADQGLTYSVTGIDSDYNYSTVTVTTDGSERHYLRGVDKRRGR
jgi:hypothetical protein